jgi:hypothetical protein
MPLSPQNMQTSVTPTRRSDPFDAPARARIIFAPPRIFFHDAMREITDWLQFP